MKILTETKAEKLVKVLRTRITRAGPTSTDTTISEAQLVRDFGVGRSTVREALSILKNEDLIVRNPGRRTVMLRKRGIRNIAFVLRHDEHASLFVTSPLAKALNHLGHSLSLLHHETLGTHPDQPAPDLIVFYHDIFHQDGPCRKTLATLQAAYPEARIVGALLGDCASDLASCRIKLDISIPNADLVRRLLEWGHRRFLYISRTEFKPHDPPDPILQGLKPALATVRDTSLQVIDTQKNLRERFIEHFSCQDHATAVIASMDSLANMAIQTLAALGRKVPEEISVSGQFNTPWSEQSTPLITSTQIDQTAFEAALPQVLQENPTEVTVPLALVWRESTGPLV